MTEVAPDPNQPIEALVVEDTDTNSPLSEVAKEVVAGRWGRGNRRKERLKAAGFDPDAVQREVNKLFNQ